MLHSRALHLTTIRAVMSVRFVVAIPITTIIVARLASNIDVFGYGGRVRGIKGIKGIKELLLNHL